MIAVATFATLVLLAAQDPLAEVDRLRDERRFAEALERSAAISDDATRHRARLNVLYYAGDLSQALEEAHAGLGHEPHDPWLLYYGALLALELRRPDAGAELTSALSSAVLASDSLTEKERTFYTGAAREFEARGQELVARDERRAGAVLRARAVLVVGCLAAVGLLFVLRRAGSGVDDYEHGGSIPPPAA